MRLKWITVLSLCLLLFPGIQQITFAQESVSVHTVAIESKGFGAKLSPDGKTLVTFENAILLGLKEIDPVYLPLRVIDIGTGEERGQLDGFTDFATDVVFTSDGSRLISAHMNGDINIWDMTSLKLLKTIQTPLFSSYQIKLFPDDKRILVVITGLPQRFLVIDTETGAITQTLGTHFESFTDFQTNYTQFPAMGDIQVSAFALSPDGTFIASASANDEVRLWTVADNHYQVVREKSEKFGRFSIRQLAFTPDGKSLIYYDTSDMKTHIWDIANQSEKGALDLGSDSFVLSADGTMMAWATREKDKPDTVSIAPVDAPDKAAVVLTLPEDLQVAPRVTWLSFTADGKQLVVGGLFVLDATANQIYVVDVP